MTFEDFKIIIRRKTGMDKYWYYFLCIAVIFLSLLGFYWFTTHSVKAKGSLYFAYAGCLFLLLLGSYGLYLLPNRYKIVTVSSDLPIAKKQLIASKLLEDIGGFTISQSQQYSFFSLKKKWWQSNFNVHFFYGDNEFAFSVQGHDFDGGFIDFGGTERKRKLIAETLKALVS